MAQVVSHHHGPTLRSLYAHKYKAVRHKFGARAPGRQIVRDGVVKNHHVRPASDHEIAVSIRVLRSMLHPPVPPVVVSSTQLASYPAAPSPNYSGGTSGAMPACTWVPESGGNYHALNPSGAGGKYQFMPDTWHGLGGTGAPQDAPPALQEAMARKLLAKSGTSPWVNC